MRLIFTSDATGLIGIHEEADYKHMTAEDIVISGLTLFAECIDGVVVGTISATAEASTAGTETKNTGA